MPRILKRDAKDGDPIKCPWNFTILYGEGHEAHCKCYQRHYWAYHNPHKLKKIRRENRPPDWINVDTSQCRGYTKYGRKCSKGMNLGERFTIPQDSVYILDRGYWLE